MNISKTTRCPIPAKGHRLPKAGRAHRLRGYAWALALGVLTGAFALLQACLPLGTAVKIGADEGFELAKTTLVLHGHRLYTEIWNDQPPLQTALITGILRHVSPSVLGPRLLTVGFAAVLLGSVFVLVLRCGAGILPVWERRGARGSAGFPSPGLAATLSPSDGAREGDFRQAGSAVLLAAVATTLLMAAPAFLELSGSVMQEIPALAPVVAALAVLVCGRPTRWRGAEFGAGLLFAVALQMKLIGAIYLPLAAFVLWQRCRGAPEDGKNMGGKKIGAEERDSAWQRGSRMEDGEGTGPSSAGLGSASVASRQLKERGGRDDRNIEDRKMMAGVGKEDRKIEDRNMRTSSESSSCHQSSCQRAWLAWLLPPEFVGSVLVFAASLVIAFVLIPFLVGEAAFFQHFRQSWEAHFAAPRALGYGTPEEHGFDWGVLLRNWDTTAPALLGVVICVRRAWARRAGCRLPSGGSPDGTGGSPVLPGIRASPALALLPVVWLALTFVVFGMHKPWWTYYYVHNAVPLCWCAGIGLVGAWQFAWTRRPVALRVLLAVFSVGAAVWMGARVYLQITGIRHGPQLYSRLVLPEIERLKPFTQFLYTDEPVYSFHAGIPLPPRLGVISLKRFWSGDLSNEQLTAELQRVKPSLMLLATDSRELPFNDFLHAEYRLVYEDAAQRLYAHQIVLEQARQVRARQP